MPHANLTTLDITGRVLAKAKAVVAKFQSQQIVLTYSWQPCLSPKGIDLVDKSPVFAISVVCSSGTRIVLLLKPSKTRRSRVQPKSTTWTLHRYLKE